MKDVQNAIYSIVETRGKECYCILCHAIDIAIEHQPTMPKMQTICNEVRIRTGKKTNGAVSRALNRAAKDIWQNGRRRELRAYCERIDFPDFRKAVGRPSGIGSF